MKREAWRVTLCFGPLLNCPYEVTELLCPWCGAMRLWCPWCKEYRCADGCAEGGEQLSF